MKRSLLGIVAVVAFMACSSEDAPGGDAELPERAEASDAGASTSRDGGSSGDAASPADAAAEAEASAPEPEKRTGEATYYDAEGLGACGTPFPSDYLLAAMNDEEYKKADCGKCVSVTGPKGTVVVRILDKCPACGPGDLDLSITAFTKIADKAAGRVNISWYFVPCPF